jgi:hypothetical protein
MTGPNVVRKAAAWLARGKDAVPPPAPTADERRQAIAALEAAIAARGQPRRRSPAWWWQSALAATVLLGVGFGLGYGLLGRKHRPVTVASVLSGQGRVEGQGVSHVLSQGLGVQGEERVQTSAGQTLQVAWGGLATVTAEAESSFALLELDHQHLLRLERGAVSLEVTPLPQGERLLVETVDLSVEVRGTAFRVAIARASGTCGANHGTTVKVTHGLVAVREKGEMVAALAAGQSWPTCVAEAPAGAWPPGGAPGLNGNQVRAPGKMAPSGVTAPRMKDTPSSPLPMKEVRRLRHVRTGGERGATSGTGRFSVRERDAEPSRARDAAPSAAVAEAEASSSGAARESPRATSSPEHAQARGKDPEPVGIAHDRATPVTGRGNEAAGATAKGPASAVTDDRSGERTEPGGARSPASALGRQNDLFALALTAEAQGKSSRALSALKQLIERWPLGPLAENARAEKMRLLVRLGRKSEAVAAARDYLAYHPAGFAHAEASSLLGGSAL